LVVILVVAGMGVTSVYYHWRAPRIIAQIQAERDALPGDSQGKLDRWLDFGAPFVHQALVASRFSAAQPWIVTHTVQPPGGPDELPQVWGVDLAGLGPEITHREGLRVVVELPQVRLLGRGRLTGDKAQHVPAYAAGRPVPDPDERAVFVARFPLRALIEALEKDIPGASFEVRIDGRTPPQGEPDGPSRGAPPTPQENG
jgi:hypothetical protein